MPAFDTTRNFRQSSTVNSFERRVVDGLQAPAVGISPLFFFFLMQVDALNNCLSRLSTFGVQYVSQHKQSSATNQQSLMVRIVIGEGTKLVPFDSAFEDNPDARK